MRKRIALSLLVSALSMNAMEVPAESSRLTWPMLDRTPSIRRTDNGFEALRDGAFVRIKPYDVSPELRDMPAAAVNTAIKKNLVRVLEMHNGDVRLEMTGYLKGGVEPVTVAAATWIAAIAIKMIRENWGNRG